MHECALTVTAAAIQMNQGPHKTGIQAASLYTAFQCEWGIKDGNRVKIEWHTSGYSKHPHDAEDGGVDGDDVRLQLLHDDAGDGEEDDQDVQLVPPAAKEYNLSCLILAKHAETT